MSNSEEKPIRRDSVRNRERLVEAAREVFAERGFVATLDDIARHAGLGTGTAYRHFPNKRAIAAEVLRDATEHIALDVQAALEVEDPWEALVQFFEHAAARQSADRSLYEALTGQGDYEVQDEIWARIVESVRVLYLRAAEAKVIREDIVFEDLAAIFALLGPAYVMSQTVHPEIWRRYLTLILDGLRAPGYTTLPGPPPTAVDIPVLMKSGKSY